MRLHQLISPFRGRFVTIGTCLIHALKAFERCLSFWRYQCGLM